MEIAIAAACGLTAWLCAFALARSSGAPTPRALRRLRAGRRVRGVVRGVARLPLVRALARRPSWVRTSLELCERAGLQGASDDEAVSLLVLLSVLAAALLSLVSRSLVGAVVAAVALAVGIPAMDAARERRRKAELVRSMPSVFRTLSMALASGETLSQAVEYLAAHERGPAAHAFANASLRLRCGSSAEEALGGLARDLDAPGVGLLTTALLISQRTGSPLRSLFDRAAALVERQGELERLLSVKTAQVRLSVRVVSALPPIMVGTLSLISPDFQRGVMTPVGLGCILVAAVLDAVAVVSIRALMRGIV
ncbi:type II secretion system F family protein [Olsenella intestinalis]|uniref:type II secretion system F family protein n=1 Tax=Olsenella intestinalis TaxID=2930083 RepID=UPI00200E0C7E|nr:type II secretion system F family protein [Olsenella intestinalis]